MPRVNITPKALEIAESAGLYVEHGLQTNVLKNGTERQRHVIEIGEEDSDFLIIYGVGNGGILYLITKPAYVEDLPAHIEDSMQLRRVVEFAALEVTR